MSNRERIAKGMELLRAGLIPFAEREWAAKYGPNWFDTLAARFELRKLKDGSTNWDTQALLKAITDTWQEVFRHVLDNVHRSYVGELRDIRNRWAHEQPLTGDDTERALDTMKRFLEAISSGAQAEEIQKLKVELQRTVFAEQARNKTRYQLTLEGMPKAGLKPWREVVTPHPDVATGRYMQAEFAADLAQVHRGEGSDEYRDPAEFYRRTFITSGIKELLSGALLRLSGKGGDPVVELQTNFGGGKTHSMLALYHLFGGAAVEKLAGIDAVLKEAGIGKVPKAKRAVLVGTDLSPAQTSKKPDGTEVRTLWGELAWQLGGKEGYAMIAESDRRGISPGARDLGQIFKKFGPCLVLIDEWVAYARQIVGKRDLPSGDFEAQTTFAQALTEAAKAATNALVVASVPASKIEIGGDHGELALETLKNVFERLGKAWRPASSDEGFEIVRRRLFEPLHDKESFVARDAVVSAFARMYKDAASDFPSGCSEEPYKRELESAYPIHPELFRRLYDDWSTLDKFQRTRGVLRLLAKVIHRLWESTDQNLMILPGFVPMDDGPTKSELTRYLPDVWEPIISLDVDGEKSLPLEIDRATPTLGRVSAARRVGRTLYVGTAPGAENKNPGIDDRSVRLGCVQPGETAAVFGDALRRLSDRAKYIHQDGNRYWLSTKANLNRMAEDRASGLLGEPETLHAEIERRLRSEQDGRKRGDFAGVHACPETSADVPDDPEARLVILGPKYAHKKSAISDGLTAVPTDSPAAKFAKEILGSKGSGPRLERNCVVFVAADRKELDALMDAAAQHLAWQSIYDERERLNLDPFHQNQAKTKADEFDKTIDIRIHASWMHALVPTQPTATAELHWDEIKVTGSDNIAKRTGVKLRQEEMLFVELDPAAIAKGDTAGRLGGLRLRMVLDQYLWSDKDHVSFAQLCEWSARFPYLPRVKSRETLARAIQDGVMKLNLDDTFVLSTGWDDDKKRYRGIKLNATGGASLVEKNTLIVKTSVAQRQVDAEALADATTDAQRPRHLTPPVPISGSGPGEAGRAPAPPQPPNLFVASVKLDNARIGRDAGRIAEEVIQHLSTLPGADAEITLEIRVKVPGGVREDLVRTITENSRTLKITAHFERE